MSNISFQVAKVQLQVKFGNNEVKLSMEITAQKVRGVTFLS